MKPWERRLFHAGALLVTLTGIAYFWVKYVVVNDDPFAVVNHPWQPGLLAWHVLASPPFVLIFGIIFNSHVMKKLKVSGLPNRRTGYVSLATFALMVASGYVLQVLTGEAALRATVVVHVASGTVFAASYASHLIISAKMARRPERRRVPREAV